MERPRYVVAQVGARRDYAVPAMLASANMLAAFYTDVCGNVGMGAVANLVTPVSAAAARLARRRIPPPLRRYTRTFPFRTALHLFRQRLAPPTAFARYRRHLEWQLSMRSPQRSFADATHFYSMHGEFPRLIKAAKNNGLRIVSEVYIAPSSDEILADERTRFPSWEPDGCDWRTVRDALQWEDVLLNCSDVFICPSEYVVDDLTRHYGIPRERTRMVPYGVSEQWLDLETDCRRGRVLFVGTAGLRKGIQYLGMAAERVRSKAELEFRVVGDAVPAVKAQPACRHLNFIGRVPRDAIATEFAQADIFVLPTLAEGSAEVVYQALAAGLPVITTRAAGSVVRDGREGRLVPERDPEALADAILELTEDRQLRQRMASAARARARDFTWSRYTDRLLAQLCSI
jgi:glycosyltransferase involved in cell wall biosynthesis